MAKPRPKTLNAAMALVAAREVAASLADLSMIGSSDVEGCARDIAKHGEVHMDGYELAKKLEDRACWDCDLQMAEELDSFARFARDQIEIAEKAWAESEGITPPFPNDTRVTLKSGETGVITEIYKHGTAKFCIAIDGDPAAAEPRNSRRIVNFEDVRPLIAAVA